MFLSRKKKRFDSLKDTDVEELHRLSELEALWAHRRGVRYEVTACHSPNPKSAQCAAFSLHVSDRAARKPLFMNRWINIQPIAFKAWSRALFQVYDLSDCSPSVEV